MKRKTAHLALLTLAGALLIGALPAAAAKGKAGYDPAADPAAELQQAIQKAQKENKRILLEIGGEWCPWCHVLDKFLKGDEEIARKLDQTFVVMKVNFSRENKNEKFLSQYPAVPGYPHMFVLESDGKLLHNQTTTEFESGKGYDREKVLAFLAKWKKGNRA